MEENAILPKESKFITLPIIAVIRKETLRECVIDQMFVFPSKIHMLKTQSQCDGIYLQVEPMRDNYAMKIEPL